MAAPTKPLSAKPRSAGGLQRVTDLIKERGIQVIDVKFTNQQMRITRLAMAPGKTLDLSTASGDPALIIALNDSTLSGFRPGEAVAIAAGQERWMDASQQARLFNPGRAPAELLRIDFRTPPLK